MRPVLVVLLLAALGCDSTGITGHADGSVDAAVDGPTASPYLAEYEKGDCMDHLCPPDDPDVEGLAVHWAGETAPDCVNVTHRCVSFNCCTTLEPEISSTVWIVRVTERETGEECWCTCRYIAWYTICGLTPGTWDIRFDFSGLSSRVSVPP